MLSGLMPPSNTPDTLLSGLDSVEAIANLLASKDGKKKLSDFRSLMQEWKEFTAKATGGLAIRDALASAEKAKEDAAQRLNAAKHEADRLLTEAKADIARRAGEAQAAAAAVRAEAERKLAAVDEMKAQARDQLEAAATKHRLADAALKEVQIRTREADAVKEALHERLRRIQEAAAA